MQIFFYCTYPLCHLFDCFISSPAQHALFSFLKDRLLKILRFLHIFFRIRPYNKKMRVRKADSLRQLSLSSVFGKCIRPPTQQNQPN